MSPIARATWDDGAGGRGGGSVFDPWLVILSALAIVLSTFPAILVAFTEDLSFYYRVLLLLADPILAALVVLLGARALTRRVPINSSIAFAGLAVAWLAVALAVHPTPLGVQLVGRQVAMVALAVVIAGVARGPARVVLCAAAAGASIAQVGLAIAQLAKGGPLGLPAIGEFADPLLRVGGALAPRGTMYHPYLLAGLALVAAGACVLAAFGSRRPAPWLVTAAVTIAPVGVTYSRTALLGLALASAVLFPRALRGSALHRGALAALLLGAGIPAALAPAGWTERAEASLERFPDRPTLIAQGLRIAAAEPLFGVGPGRYLHALAEAEAREPGSVQVFQEPHAVPVLIAAEGGIVAGAALLVALALLLRDAFRSGPAALAAFALFAPFLVLDHYPYTHAQGAVIFGTWFGVVAAWSGRARATTHS